MIDDDFDLEIAPVRIQSGLNTNWAEEQRRWTEEAVKQGRKDSEFLSPPLMMALMVCQFRLQAVLCAGAMKEVRADN